MQKFTEKHFTLILFTACVLYFSFEYVNAHYTIFYADDFWFTHWIYQFKDHLPYRDFIPHSTVLGYYLLLPALLHTSDIFTPLYHLKITLALINSILFFSTGCWLTRFFSKPAVLTSVILILFAEFVLSNSINIRIDILCYWFCLLAILCVFENKFVLAGLMLALGFMTSQKAIWYIIATNAALVIDWLIYARSWQRLRQIVLFNCVLGIALSAYFAFWSHYSSFALLLQNTFLDARVIYKITIYNSARPYFWGMLLSNNPLLFLLWPVTLLSLLNTCKADTTYRRRLFSCVYASCMMLCLIPYKQVFPYYTLALIPAFLLLYAGFFTWLFNFFSSNQSMNRTICVALLVIYFACLIYLRTLIIFPIAYFCVGLIPVFLVMHRAESQKIIAQLTYAILILIGLACPLFCFATHLRLMEGSYQKSMLTLANKLLQTGGEYLAGIEFFYNKTQPVPGLRQLDLPALAYLYHPKPELAAVMIPALEHEKMSPEQLLQALRVSTIKFYINNVRMNALPNYLKTYLADNYQQYWGSIYLYAPLITHNTQTITIKFSGNYLLQSPSAIQLDGKKITANTRVLLSAGTHRSHASTDYRLQWLPPNLQPFLNPAYPFDNWSYMSR